LRYEAIFFTSITFPNLDLLAARKLTIVNSEGLPDCIWMAVLQADLSKVTPVDPFTEQEINPSIFDPMDNFEKESPKFVPRALWSSTTTRPSLKAHDVPPIKVFGANGLLRGQEWEWDSLDQ
jgi:hypothetical protein